MTLITVEDLRSEGVSESQASDDRLDALIVQATAFISRVTGQVFEAYEDTILLDGNGRALLHLPIFCAEVTEVLLDGGDVTDEVIVYNRTFPIDDRRNPKIKLDGGTFSEGDQNVSITGIFGFVDVASGPTYSTPVEIQEICKRLVIQAIPLLTSADRAANENKGRILEETFDTQTYRYVMSEGTFTKLWTSDGYVNQVLLSYRRPLALGVI